MTEQKRTLVSGPPVDRFHRLGRVANCLGTRLTLSISPLGLRYDGIVFNLISVLYSNDYPETWNPCFGITYALAIRPSAGFRVPLL